MDTNQPTTPVAPPPVTTTYAPSSPGMFGTKIPSAVAFAIGILLFLLPFSELKCGGSTIASKTGLAIALKKEWKPVMGMGTKDLGDMSAKTSSTDNGNSWICAIAALGLGILGLLISFANGKTAGGIGLVSGVLSAGALIAMMLQLKSEVNASIAKQAVEKTSEGADTFGLDKIGNTMNNYKPTLAFTPWFYIAVIAFLAAAFFCYKRMSASKP